MRGDLLKLRSLALQNYGPFSRYRIDFPPDDQICVLLTGKNNEGKTSLITALRLVASAATAITTPSLQVNVGGLACHRLPKYDTENIVIQRLLHNYAGDRASITAELDNGFEISVHLDEETHLIYGHHYGRVPEGVRDVLGFIPPLGPLAEREEILTPTHIRRSIGTTLAPRHLRNHFAQLLTDEERELVRTVISETWPEVELLEWRHDYGDNSLKCYFREQRIDREISWAGQGLQVWFQIVTHLVRLRESAVLVLDEPEIFLHPEKQNELIQMLKERHEGSQVIATHSVELMNNVAVSHILHVRKSQTRPLVKETRDRAALDLIRSRIGSRFNIVASQFEDCDLLVFTEDDDDYRLLTSLAAGWDLSTRAYGISLHGFSEYTKAPVYRDAYRMLLGKKIPCTMLLDRDYYPPAYLDRLRVELEAAGIAVYFTPGKEIENAFLAPEALAGLIPPLLAAKFSTFWNTVFRDLWHDCEGSFVTLYEQFLDPHVDTKTIITDYVPALQAGWSDLDTRHLLVAGKKALKSLRQFYRQATGQNLTRSRLVQVAVESDDGSLQELVRKVLVP